jgi:hypothetical protein
MFLQLLIALPAIVWTSVAAASDTKVIINLSEQRAYLIEQGRVTLLSPVASGKPGWLTPTGNFRIFNKDIDHRSRSFGSVVDAYGRVVNLMQLRAAIYPRAAIMAPHRCLTLWNSARRLGCTPVTFQAIPRPTGACGCLENALRCFLSGSVLARQSRSSAARTTWLASEKPFRYCPLLHSCWDGVDVST